MTAFLCVLAVTSAPHHHVPSATGRLPLFLSIQLMTSYLRSIRTLHMTSYLRSIASKIIHRHLRIHTSFMAKKPPPSESVMHSALADSHLNLSSLTSRTSFVDVDALTISPTASTTSHSAAAQSAASSVSLSVLFLHF